MLKALIKKQLLEVFNRLATSKKRGKKMSVAGFAVLFGFIFLTMAASMFALGSFFAITLFPIGMGWMYFAMMGLFSMFCSLLGSVFIAYNSIFTPKDNDLLLAMPIPSGKIVFARMLGVYADVFFWFMMVWLPTLIGYYVFGDVTVGGVIISFIMTFVLSALVLVLSCLLGWVVALIASHVKSKAFVTVLISIALIGLYYVLYFKLNTYMQAFAEHVSDVEKALTGWGYPTYLFGSACMGEIVPAIIFILAVAAILALCGFVISKTFLKIATKKTGTVKKEYHEAAVKKKSQKSALLRREIKHFFSSPAYMMNCGLGVILMLAVVVLLIVKQADIGMFLTAVSEETAGSIESGFDITEFVKSAIIVLLPAAACFIALMDCITAPSISLEGRSLWLIRSLPVKGEDVLESKINLHLIVNMPPTAILVFVAGIIFGCSAQESIIMMVTALLFVYLFALLGIMFGLRKPRFDWTNETIPIKQSMSVLFGLLGGWATQLIFAGLFLLLRLKFDINIQGIKYLQYTIVILMAFIILMRRWIRDKGAKKFEAL